MTATQDLYFDTHTRQDIIALIDDKWESNPKTYRTRLAVNSFATDLPIMCYAGEFSPTGLTSPFEISIGNNFIEMCEALRPDTNYDFQIEDDIDLIARLRHLFSIRNFDAVQDFVLHNIQLIDVLEELQGRLHLIFGKTIRNIYLEHFDDPEDNHSGIYIEVDTELSVDKKLELLDKFDFEYWLDKDADIRKYITVTV